MTRSIPQDPAAGPPEPGRVAQAMPGEPAAADHPPREAAAGGKTSRRGRSGSGAAAGDKPGGSGRRWSLPAADPGKPEPGRAHVVGCSSTEARPGQGPAARTWTLELPAGMKLLSLNHRGHWAERHRRTQALKKAAWALALSQKIPRLERVSVTAEYQPGDLRHRDAENTCAASGKACVDGLVAAGVLEDDECPRYVTGIYCTIGPLYPKGRLVLYVTEEPPGAPGGGDAA